MGLMCGICLTLHEEQFGEHGVTRSRESLVGTLNPWGGVSVPPRSKDGDPIHRWHWFCKIPFTHQSAFNCGSCLV